MHLYLTDAQIPELGLLPRESRRVVMLRALKMLRADSRLFYWLPVILCALGTPVGSMVGGLLVQLLHPQPTTPFGDRIVLIICGTFGGIGVVAFFAGFIGLLFQRWKLRPYLRQAIEAQGRPDGMGNSG